MYFIKMHARGERRDTESRSENKLIEREQKRVYREIRGNEIV